MTRNRTSGSARVREPVQVYLDGSDQDRLERLTAQLDTTKSDILRRGLEALERELSDPAQHPALRIIGLLREGAGSETDVGPEAGGVDAAREHDRFLLDAEEGTWTSRRDEWPGV